MNILGNIGNAVKDVAKTVGNFFQPQQGSTPVNRANDPSRVFQPAPVGRTLPVQAPGKPLPVQAPTKVTPSPAPTRNTPPLPTPQVKVTPTPQPPLATPLITPMPQQTPPKPRTKTVM